MTERSPSPLTADNSSRHVDVGGLRVHYHEAGTGEPVFLLHGGGPGASGWSNFNRNVESFAPHYRTLIPDFPGFGQSAARNLSGGLFTAMAEWLLELLDTLNIKKAHLVGNSMGGGTAIKLALEHPDRVGKIVLMAPGGFLPPFTVMPSEGLKVLFNFYALPPTRERLLSFLTCMVYDTRSLTEDLLEQRLQSASNPAILANPPFKPGSPPPVEDLWRDQRLSALDHRFLLIWGRDDRTIPLDGAFTGLKQLRNAELHVFSQCGHWVQWEKAESFNRLVIDFLG